MSALQFVGGDVVRETFLLLKTDGSILDLSTCDLIGGVWWRGGKHFDITLDNEIEIYSVSPALALEGQPQDPHGFITLSSLQSARVPVGLIASIRLVATTIIDEIVMSSFFSPLERIR